MNGVTGEVDMEGMSCQLVPQGKTDSHGQNIEVIVGQSLEDAVLLR